ncbi:BEL1-like homeodomain protein 1 [Cornus florida]|uniref:BEL1-like homeodomain protein 1 n=1 Tax=Cornus florida TaxID=4283 RepID=UPI0028A247C0|nr:BEL1-like homeodomain protein 1 [Cornus florida]XP_059627799.1 BEL1-like homeodomain protein 1 [Cornus florida]XP_059627800.1 BEL1-like homeodomain protein 1 [Cornus florida]
MASTYFHGSSEIQADTLQTLYLMNLNYVGYSDTQHQHQQQQQQPPPPGNMLFLNSAATGASHAPPSHNQHFFGVPLPSATTTAVGSASSDDLNRQSVHSQHEIPVLHGVVPRFHYNLWSSGDQTAAGSHPHPHIQASNSTAATADVASQMGFRRPVVSPTQQQGLSLSLSPQRPAYKSFPDERDVPIQAPVTVISPTSGNDIRGSGGSSSSVSNGINGMQSVMLGSKYLKAAQQLLDEVANVGKGIKEDSSDEIKNKAKMGRESMAAVAGESSSGGESSMKRVVELTTAQRQELQMKKAKLVSMLDEVEQRYRQYHQQMQIVVASFEQAAGFGSAKSYTALALQTISKQFRCLKDAISGQIKATSKSLGEEDCLGGKVEGSRLKFVDHQLRQQRALQQLGMIQHNAWRPQRGLPERAVSVLRAWLFEHFLHPYPKDSDKHLLAKQTGLTRSQVSNWFINARVRLWKPMVEEMYLEETKDQEQNGSEDNTRKIGSNKESGSKSTGPQETNTARMDQISSFQSKQEKSINQNASPNEVSNSTVSTSPFRGSFQSQAGFSLIGSSDIENVVQRSPKKPRSYEMQNSPSSILSMDMDMKPGESSKAMNEKFGSREKQTKNSYHPFMAGTTSTDGNGFGAYSIGEFERFNPEQLGTRFHGNGVSLTLGLPHCENLSLSGSQQDYIPSQHIHQLGSRLEMGGVDAHYNGISTPQPSHSSIGYEDMNIQNRKRFAAQLLPDFVA